MLSVHLVLESTLERRRGRVELQWIDESKRWNGLGVGAVSPGLLSDTCVRSIGLNKLKLCVIECIGFSLNV